MPDEWIGLADRTAPPQQIGHVEPLAHIKFLPF